MALAAANWQLQLACVPMSKSRSCEENIYFSSPLSGTTSIGQELPQKHGNEHGRNPTGFMIPVRLCTKFHGCLCTLAALAAFALDSLSFPTCQMRVSRFHQMCFLLLLLPQQPRISKFRISVGTAGPQPGTPDLSGHCWTSPRRQIECQKECQIECQTKYAIIIHNILPDGTSETIYIYLT